MSSPTQTIIHVITGIGVGGAEFMLVRTIAHTDRSRFSHIVVSLKGRGDLAAQIESAGAASLICLDIQGPLTALRGFLDLRRLIRTHRPTIVQTWLAHATLFGTLASLAAQNPRILWCVHTGNQDPARVSRPVRVINRLLGYLSGFAPKVIVSVSEAAAAHCRNLGFPPGRLRIIPNGTDTARFHPDPAAGARLRDFLGIPAGSPVIGIVGRHTPEKDFPTFFRAALRLQQSLPQTHFLLCGKGLASTMPEAHAALPHSPFPDRFHFLGAREEMPPVYNACSIVVLTSISEAFPLVLGEAMACGIPVAATDVGDCALLIGPAGRICPARDPDAIASSWAELLLQPAVDRQQLSATARRRIESLYSLRQCMARYEELYKELSLSTATTHPRPAIAPINHSPQIS